MLTFSSSVRVESKTHPGIFYIVKKRSEGRRIQLRALLKDIAPKTTALEQAIAAVGPLPHAQKENENLTESELQDQKVWQDSVLPLLQQYEELMQDTVHPIWVKWALHSVEGLTVDDPDGKPQKITGTNAAELLTEDLFTEALEVVQDACELGQTRSKNSSSLTISNAAAVGETSDTTADSAERGAYTESGTAFGTSPTT